MSVMYKGRPYELAWQGRTKYGDRAKLRMSDGREFWVDSSALRGGGGSAPAAPPPVKPRSYTHSPSTSRTAGTIDNTSFLSLDYQRTGESDAKQFLGRVVLHDGNYYTVVGAQTHYISNEMNEDAGDMQGGGWAATLWVRPSTEAEAAPSVAAKKQKEVLASAKKRMGTIESLILGGGTLGAYDEDAPAGAKPVPHEAWEWHTEKRSGSAGRWIYVDGDTVHVTDAGFYDDYRHQHRWMLDAGIAAEIKELRDILT